MHRGPSGTPGIWHFYFGYFVILILGVGFCVAVLFRMLAIMRKRIFLDFVRLALDGLLELEAKVVEVAVG